ncbi:peptidyl-prolyl cis-trans isomerase D [Trichlorobacter thiogenes]|uniref:Periplasmic chaperone PpiD n=1 Tax=Trichlorobacter thiogenes TaxID=115783 RepID=A0A1T4RVU9_9BACT|nr:peptidylprolyl isomerase [Trichlorobacter thiogenes]SKA20065.1 peptidyl-prolyl cis-trans isomerase D [Trichlorobacter thiogenes]
MLDVIRKKKDSVVIKAVFIIIVLSFIGTIFLVWGKGDEGMGRSTGYAAKVDRTVISLEAFQNAYQNMTETYRQIFGGNFTPELEKQLNLRQQVIDRLIDSTLIMKAAKSQGVTVSKEDISAAIAAMPAFQQNGSFDFSLYQQMLKANRITPEAYEESKKRELLIDKTRKAVMDKVTISDDEALKQFHKEQDKLELSYVSFAAADVAGEVKLSDADLQDFLTKNAEKFRTPEKVALSWFVLENASQTHAQPVTAEEQKTFYDKNMDRYLDKDNAPIPYEQVKERVKADAVRQKASKALYEKAADTLFQNIKSGDLALVAGKLGAKIQDTPLFSATTAPAALAGETALIKKAFELKQGELGGPVETVKGIYIFKVKEKKAAELPPLAQVRATVEQQVRAIKAAELAKQKAVEAQKALAAGGAGLKLQATPAFGYNAKGDLPGIGSSKPLMEKAFELTTASAAASEPILVGNRWYAVRLKQRIAAPQTDFTPRKDEIKKRMLPAKQEETLRNWLKELRSKAKIVINPALTAANQ